MSAEHCVTLTNSMSALPFQSSVRVGALTASSGQKYPLDFIVKHGTADISLLRTFYDISLGAHVFPACLPKLDFCFKEGNTVWASGYGLTSYSR